MWSDLSESTAGVGESSRGWATLFARPADRDLERRASVDSRDGWFSQWQPLSKQGDNAIRTHIRGPTARDRLPSGVRLNTREASPTGDRLTHMSSDSLYDCCQDKDQLLDNAASSTLRAGGSESFWNSHSALLSSASVDIRWAEICALSLPGSHGQEPPSPGPPAARSAY